MVCLATTKQAKKAAIDLARNRNLRLEEKLKEANADLAKANKSLALVNSEDAKDAEWVAFAKEYDYDLTTIEVDGKHGGTITVFESESTEIAYQAFCAGWGLRVKGQEYDPFEDSKGEK